MSYKIYDLDDLFDNIHSVYDNGGRTADQFTVVFHDAVRQPSGIVYNHCLSLSHNCDMPNGVNMFGDCVPGEHMGAEITFEDLPNTVQRAVIRRITAFPINISLELDNYMMHRYDIMMDCKR